MAHPPDRASQCTRLFSAAAVIGRLRLHRSGHRCIVGRRPIDQASSPAGVVVQPPIPRLVRNRGSDAATCAASLFPSALQQEVGSVWLWPRARWLIARLVCFLSIYLCSNYFSDACICQSPYTIERNASRKHTIHEASALVVPSLLG
jgi:hypothetical protein